ncbi:MAG: hypothetical protein H7Y11_02590 [Armatimonadetes bacterium]|nr:hypothetical protein [Anaerolineae bacterium]
MQDTLPLPNDISSVDEPLTPREARLERAARGVQLGAALNGLVALLLALVGIGAALLSVNGVYSALHTLLLFGFTGADDQAVIALLLLLLGNTSLLLVVMVGILAQELWAFVIGVLLLLGNVALLVTQGFTPALIALGALIWCTSVLLPDLRAFRTNPVMMKELRERMRGARAFAVMTVYLSLMSAFSILLYIGFSPLSRGISTSVTGELGRVLFAGVVGIELVLIIFIAPAFTAGAVTGERERKTYDLLQITLLPRPSFIMGKLESALGYILLLLLAAIPLQSMAFLFGGVSEQEVGLSFAILIVTAVTLGTVGLFFSTIAERTLTASVRAYTFTFSLIFAVPAILGIIVSIISGFAYAPSGTALVSPFLEGTLIYLIQFIICLNPMATALVTRDLLVSQQTVGFYTTTLSSNGSTIPLVSPWIGFGIIYLVLAAVLLTLAIRRMRRSEL